MVESRLGSGERISSRERVFAEETWISWSPQEEQLAGIHILLLFAGEMESKIDYICDGVVVDQHLLSWTSSRLRVLGKSLPQSSAKVSLRVLVPVRRSDLDLSHFKVRREVEPIDELLPFLRVKIVETIHCALEMMEQLDLNFSKRLGGTLLAKARDEFVRKLPYLGKMNDSMKRNAVTMELNSLLKSLSDE